MEWKSCPLDKKIDLGSIVIRAIRKKGKIRLQRYDSKGNSFKEENLCPGTFNVGVRAVQKL